MRAVAGREAVRPGLRAKRPETATPASRINADLPQAARLLRVALAACGNGGGRLRAGLRQEDNCGERRLNMPWNILKECVEPLLPSAILAGIGGVARFCVGGNHTLRALISGLVVSFFAGSVAALLLADAPLSANTKIAFGGMAGFMGDWFLGSISRRVVKGIAAVSTPWDGVERRKTNRP